MAVGARAKLGSRSILKNVKKILQVIVVSLDLPRRMRDLLNSRPVPNFDVALCVRLGHAIVRPLLEFHENDAIVPSVALSKEENVNPAGRIREFVLNDYFVLTQTRYFKRVLQEIE